MTTQTPKDLLGLQEAVWKGSLPLQIRLARGDCRTYDQSDPYLVQYPRLSYLPFLLPGLQTFFRKVLINPELTVASAWFSFEGVPLIWHYPVGLLYDLFSGAQPAHAPRQQGHGNLYQAQSQPSGLPWKLILHFSEFPDDQLVRLDEEGKVLQDSFINSVKEADFLRNGTAKAIMTLSKADSTMLWEAVQAHDLPTFSRIQYKLLPASVSLRHIPIRYYLPSSAPSSKTTGPDDPDATSETTPGHINVIQSLASPKLGHSRDPQTLGTALHAALPSLFPSRRTPILARPVLHGAVVPMSAVLEDLMRSTAFMDGWLHLGVEMIG